MRKNIYKIGLAMIIALQIVYSTYVFAYEKVGAHSDEAWSYGLANSYYCPFYVLKDGLNIQEYVWHEQEHFVNSNRWISGKILRDYLTVQEGEQFAYDSVYYNNSFDAHPFLYHLILHTICSFFPDQFSWWYGFALNMVFLLGTQIFLFLLVKKICRSEWIALMTCMFYAGGKGALCTFTFIRQYTLLVMLGVMFTYFTACFYEKSEENAKVPVKPLAAAAVCACASFLTHYYGISYVGIFTAFFCIWLLFRKKIKCMFAYGLSMVVALGAFIAIYPPAIYDITIDDGKPIKYFSPPVQIRILLSDLFEYNFGFTIGYFPTVFWNVTIPLLIAACVMTVGLLFPFRHEEWFGRFIQYLKNTLRNFWNYLKRANYIPMIGFLSAYVLFEWVAHYTDVYVLGKFSMRYTCMVLPVIAMAFVVSISFLLKKLIKRERVVRGIVFLLLAAILIKVHLTAVYPYSFASFGADTYRSEMYRGKNVLVVDGSTFFRLTASAFFSPVFWEANQVCFTALNVMEDYVNTDEFKAVDIDYVFVNENMFDLTPEEDAMVEAWIAESKNKGRMAFNEADLDTDLFVVEDERENVDLEGEEAKEKPCTAFVKGLAPNGEYELVSYFVGQVGTYYVLAVK